MSKGINIFKHGGYTRKMLTLEIGRYSKRGENAHSAEEVLADVARWLIENGVCVKSGTVITQVTREQLLNMSDSGNGRP